MKIMDDSKLNAITAEPVRHSAGERNRRKALHNAECLLEELQFLQKEANARLVNLQYANHRACRLVNRLKAEAIGDHNNAK